MGKVAVIDYGMGNLHSVCKAFERVGASPEILREPADPDGFTHLVLPGVGALGDCMRGLKSRKLDSWVRSWVAEDRPFLGVCLGLQALFEYSEEFNTVGLGLLPGRVVRFCLEQPFKIPHMGWNTVTFKPLANEMDAGMLEPPGQFYFDHSYYVQPEDLELIWGWTHHGHTFASAVRHGRCHAVQFHPEKSQAIGLQMYQNFMTV